MRNRMYYKQPRPWKFALDPGGPKKNRGATCKLKHRLVPEAEQQQKWCPGVSTGLVVS